MPKSYLFLRDGVQRSVLTITEDAHEEQLIAGNQHMGKIGHDLCCPSNTSETEITGTSCTINPSSGPSSDNLLGAEYIESKSTTSSDTQEILRSKALSSSMRAKVEPILSDEFGDVGNYLMENFTCSVLPVKKELGVKLSPAETCSFSVSRNFNYQNKTVRSPVKLGMNRSESVKLSIFESNDAGPSSLMEHKLSDGQEKGTNSPKASSLPSAICVKMEPVLSNGIDNEGKTYWGKSRSPDMLPVKPEATFPVEAFEDELDHMSLFDRLVLLSTESSPSSKVSIRGFRRGVSETVESISVTRPRKRSRTAT